MTYDVILLSPDNLNGSEEEIVDLQKKKWRNTHSKVEAEPKASWSDNAFWFGVYGIVQQSRFLP